METLSQFENRLLNDLWEEVITDILRKEKGSDLDSDDLDIINQIVNEIKSSSYLQD